MPLIPFVFEKQVNTGSVAQPNYQLVKSVGFYKSNNWGDYQICKDCREGLKKNPKYKVNPHVHGSSRCTKHTERYYKNIKKASVRQD